VTDTLVVENSPTILKLLSHHLEAEGCSVRSAGNGLEALVEIDRSVPDIILTDIIMPKLSGDQLCSIIRNDAKLKDIFIAVHSSTSLEDNHIILELDADVYIAKGPLVNIKKHVHHVLHQYRQGIRRDQTTIGEDTLQPREITKELLLARKHHNAIFNNIAEAVIEMDSNGRIVQANKATLPLLQKGLLEILSFNFIDLLHGKGKAEVAQWFSEITHDGPRSYRSSYETPLQINRCKILLHLVAAEEDGDFFVIGILQDVTRQKDTEQQLARTLNEFNAVTDTIDYGILLLDTNLRLRITNQAYRRIWQIPKSFTDGFPSMREIMEYNATNGKYNIPPKGIHRFIEARLNSIRNGAFGPVELKQPDGSTLQYQCAVLPDDGRLLTYYEITTLKNTEQKLEAALAKVSDLANHDPLTGLPNLRLSRERLLSALSFAKRKRWMAALMFIDLDGFKEVNDSHGHDLGDKLLKKVARRLVKSLRDSDTVARIGGDEFLVIQTEAPDREAIAKVAEKIVKNIAQPFSLDGISINIGASIGIAVYPHNGDKPRELMKKADDAMYYTKRIGKNSYSFAPN
jgi:diguanylate cyclase (GGDEF)-like protein/PAS domain S-box-containing protein